MTVRPAWINLPHAATIVGRLWLYLGGRREPQPFESTRLEEYLVALDDLLGRFTADPAEDVACQAAERAVLTARALAEEIVRAGYRGDRLGQCVRNLFECLGFPEEGAERSLACGEKESSLLRP